MKRLISIAILVLLAGLPLAAPLLAQSKTCCGGSKGCDPTFRPDVSCCHVTPLPGSATTGKLSVSPALPAPVQTEIAAQPLVVIGATIFPEVTLTSHIVFLQAPLRI